MEKFEYIDYAMASCPAPWSSVDAGELWLTGDYFMTLQKFPLSALAITEDAPASPYLMPIIYPYALLVYHKIDKDYPKVLSIFAITIEITNYGSELSDAIAAKIDPHMPIKEILKGGTAPIFFCMFYAQGRSNFGFYKGELEREPIRDLFFAKLASIIHYDKRSEKIGVMADAFGNPKTGVPARLKENALYSWLEYV